ncbi:MAG TPA: hypothetical protein VFU02_03200 [Polyangiaceae bacterium]|nr:hypothetical protein [Polyangiaceae bacterium]
MTDILKNLAVDVHCDQCGDFTVGADVIADSQRMLADGCPGSSHECPPTLLATLLPQAALQSLEKAWRDLESAARRPVRQITIEESSQIPTRPADQVDPRIISRWEDDGGYVPTPVRSAPVDPASL